MKEPERSTPGRPARPGSGNTVDASSTGQRLRTLLVEDNRIDARLTQEGLRDCDARIDCDIATTLQEVSALRLATVDCAVIDLGLPDATGLQAVDRIRGLAPHLPIVVLTGIDDAATGPATLRHGAQDYLVKQHTDGPTIARAIRLAVERKRLQSAAIQSVSGDVELPDDLLQRLYAIGLALQITHRRSAPLPEVADRITHHIDDLQLIVQQLRSIITGQDPGPGSGALPSQPTRT